LGAVFSGPYIVKSFFQNLPSAPIKADTGEAQFNDLRAQIAKCWDAKSASTQIIPVEIVIEVNPDKSIREAHVVDQARLSHD
jgi:hypothetical protein